MVISQNGEKHYDPVTGPKLAFKNSVLRGTATHENMHNRPGGVIDLTL